MHLPWMAFAGMLPGFPDVDVARLMAPRTFGARAFPQMGTNLNISEVTATSTAAYHADLIECSNSSDITLSLHPAARMRGKVLTIKKTGNNTNTIVIDPDSTETIDGETTITLYIRYDFLTIYSNGTNWQIISDGRFKHSAHMTKSNAQTIAANTSVKIELNDSVFDGTGTMVDTGNYRITIKRAGTYVIIGWVRIGLVAADKFVQCGIWQNGGQISYANADTSYANAYPIPKDVTVADLAAGDFIYLYTYQNDASLSTDGGSGSASPHLVVSEL